MCVVGAVVSTDVQINGENGVLGATLSGVVGRLFDSAVVLVRTPISVDISVDFS